MAGAAGATVLIISDGHANAGITDPDDDGLLIELGHDIQPAIPDCSRVSGVDGSASAPAQAG